MAGRARTLSGASPTGVLARTKGCQVEDSLELPEDVQGAILSFCDVKMLLALGSCNRAWEGRVGAPGLWAHLLMRDYTVGLRLDSSSLTAATVQMARVFGEDFAELALVSPKTGYMQQFRDHKVAVAALAKSQLAAQQAENDGRVEAQTAEHHYLYFLPRGIWQETWSSSDIEAGGVAAVTVGAVAPLLVAAWWFGVWPALTHTAAMLFHASTTVGVLFGGMAMIEHESGDVHRFTRGVLGLLRGGLARGGVHPAWLQAPSDFTVEATVLGGVPAAVLLSILPWALGAMSSLPFPVALVLLLLQHILVPLSWVLPAVALFFAVEARSNARGSNWVDEEEMYISIGLLGFWVLNLGGLAMVASAAGGLPSIATGTLPVLWNAVTLVATAFATAFTLLFLGNGVAYLLGRVWASHPALVRAWTSMPVDTAPLAFLDHGRAWLDHTSTEECLSIVGVSLAVMFGGDNILLPILQWMGAYSQPHAPTLYPDPAAALIFHLDALRAVTWAGLAASATLLVGAHSIPAFGRSLRVGTWTSPLLFFHILGAPIALCLWGVGEALGGVVGSRGVMAMLDPTPHLWNPAVMTMQEDPLLAGGWWVLSGGLTSLCRGLLTTAYYALWMPLYCPCLTLWRVVAWTGLFGEQGWAQPSLVGIDQCWDVFNPLGWLWAAGRGVWWACTWPFASAPPPPAPTCPAPLHYGAAVTQRPVGGDWSPPWTAWDLLPPFQVTLALAALAVLAAAIVAADHYHTQRREHRRWERQEERRVRDARRIDRNAVRAAEREAQRARALGQRQRMRARARDR